MTTARDLAAHLLRHHGEMTAMKLQKLCYYVQAWSLAWGRGPVFDEPIEAWANGPVVPSLWREHRGAHRVTSVAGNAEAVPAHHHATIDAVMEFYAHRDAEWLSELTHREAPWLEAREGLPPGARSASPITRESMTEYYGGLARAMDARAMGAEAVHAPVLTEAYARGCELLLSLAPHEVARFAEPVDVSDEDVDRWLREGGEAPWPGPSSTRTASS
jgi:uncharacterized phage-associated protein